MPCLVVRLSYPAGKPVWVETEGMDDDVAGHEHRFYTRANKYTGVFWPVAPDAARAKLRALRLVSVDRFKNDQRGATRRVELSLEGFPDLKLPVPSLPK